MTDLSALAQSAVGSPTGAFILFFALVIGHALADFPLQGQFLAMGKNRHVKMPDPEGAPFPDNLWFYCLSAHAFIHAGPVWLITGSVVFAFGELVLHWLIDYAKNEKWTNFAGDQAMHVGCKAIYSALICAGIGM